MFWQVSTHSAATPSTFFGRPIGPRDKLKEIKRVSVAGGLMGPLQEMQYAVSHGEAIGTGALRFSFIRRICFSPFRIPHP